MSFQIIEWDDLTGKKPEKSAVTIGVFDGLHLGHRELIRRVVGHGPNPTVISFRENPKKILYPEKYKGDIFSQRQKLAAFNNMGLSRLILIDFSEKINKLKGRDFLDLLENRVNMAFMAIGTNFRCGHGQDTDAALIKERNERKGIPTELVSPLGLPGATEAEPVSSSRIRSAIISGDVKLAAALMGRNFVLDLADLQGEDQVYDLRSVQRVIPMEGRYPVLIHPGCISGWAEAENGKICLSKTNSGFVESIEFITS